MELRHLRYFIVLAEELNFSRAASRLHIAQPPLSQQIRSLEDELGVQLYDRHQRQLTAAGQAFLQEARQVISQLEKAVVSAQRANQGKIGSLTVGFNSTIANSIFPEILQVFRLRFPDVVLTLHELVSYRQLEKLRDRKLDVGFVHTHNLHPMNDKDNDLCFMSILQEPLVVALPNTHPLAIQTQVSLKAFADELFILPPPHLVLYSQIVSLCQQVGFSPKVAQEATWMLTVLSLVAGGVGVALLPANAQNVQRSGVVYKSIQEQFLTLQMAVVWRRDDASTILREFLNIVHSVTQTC